MALAFLPVAGLELMAAGSHNALMELATKPLLLPVLIIISLAALQDTQGRFKHWFITALVFSWFGDILLMLTGEGELFFLAGLGAFLVAQIFFIITYAVMARYGRMNGSVKPKVWWLLPYLLYGGGLIWLLFPGLGDFLVPVVVYAITLLIMSCTALILFTRSGRGSWWLFAGSVLFVISDSLIAIDRFYAMLPNGHFWVMATYAPAQGFMTLGVIYIAHLPARA